MCTARAAGANAAAAVAAGQPVFDLIIAADVLYEDDHPALLEAVLRARLAPAGGCFVAVVSVRWPAQLADFQARLEGLCDVVCIRPVDTNGGGCSSTVSSSTRSTPMSPPPQTPPTGEKPDGGEGEECGGGGDDDWGLVIALTPTTQHADYYAGGIQRIYARRR